MEKHQGTFPLRGHCWRAALLAVFRLIAVIFVSGCKPGFRQLATTGLHRSREFGFQGSRSRDLICQRKKRMLLMRGSRDEPLQNSIEIRFLFGTDAVAGYLAMGHALQVQGFDQLVHREMAAKIRLVTQDQEWNPLHGWLLKENVELFFGYW